MKKQTMTLAGIPAILYGSRSRNVYLYLHGKNGCKEEAERFAATACEAGWQVLAIDLPEHGARKNSPERLLPWVAVPEIEAVYARMKPVWAHIRLYGVSIGAWLAMQALQGDAPEQALLVSPVVDMEALITNMMQCAHVTEEQLHRAGEIPTDLGETLSWAGRGSRRISCGSRERLPLRSGRHCPGSTFAGCGNIRCTGMAARRCCMVTGMP